MPSLSLPFLARKSPAETAQGQAAPAALISTGPYLYDRVKETSTSTGTGTLSLDGVGGLNFERFVDLVGNGNSCYYEIVNRSANERETGLGIVTAGTAGSPDTLSRTTVLGSSNGNGPVNFSSGTKDVFATIPAAIVSPMNTELNIKGFGAKGDVALLNDGQMTVGSPVLVCPSGPFKSTDPGKFVSVLGPGVQGNFLGASTYVLGKILSYQSATQVTLDTNATITLSGCQVLYGTDDSDAINAAMLAASIAPSGTAAQDRSVRAGGGESAGVGGGEVYAPPGTYFVTKPIIWYTRTHLRGAGPDTTIFMLAPGAACDIIQGNGFFSLTSTTSTGGIHSCSLRDLTINGYSNHGGYAHTTITSAATTYDTTLNVGSTAGFPSSGLVMVFDNLNNSSGEIIGYTGKTATTLTGCVRGLENTVPQAFQGGESVDPRRDGVGVGATYLPGYGLRFYGRPAIVENVMIRNCEQDGWYSEWSNISSALPPDGYQTRIINCKSHVNNGHGIWHNGPHDAKYICCDIYSNTMIGVKCGPGNVAETLFIGCHSAGAQNWSYSIEGFALLYNCIAEQALFGQIYLVGPAASSTQIIGCRLFADPATKFTRGIVMAGALTGCTFEASINDCNDGSIDFLGDGGNNSYRCNIRQAGGGPLFVNAAHVLSSLFLTTQPGNTLLLSGISSQQTAPAVFRSAQGDAATMIVRAPFNQSVNILEGQVAQYTNAGTISKRFAFDKAGNLALGHGTPTAAVHAIGGGAKIIKIANPAAPTGTAFGGSGTNVDYFVVAEDIAGNKTIASAKVTVSGGAALSSSVWNRIQPADIGAYKYNILKTNTTTLLGVIQPNTGGTIGRINVTAGGANYTGSAPNVGLSGPVQCAPLATATISGGLLKSVAIQTAGAFGYGFTSVPNVVVGGPGNGAAVTAVMGVARVTGFGAAGSGYAVNDEITLTGGTFTTAAVLKVSAVSGGAITQVQIKTVGAYSVLPSNPVAQGSTTGQGTAATFNISWGVVDYTVTNSGTGYNTVPPIGLNGGGALPTMTAILAANAVSAISILNGTLFYLTTPTVVIQGISAGSGASATASLSELYLDDTGQATSGFTSPTRNGTADATIDGVLTANELVDTPYVTTDKEFLRHYETVTSAAATLATIAGIARTVTSAVAATNQKNAGGEWLRISATANNADANLVPATFTETQVQASFVFNTRVEIPTAKVNMRVFIGLGSAGFVLTTDTQSTIHSLYFRFSTGASDANWMCCSSNASSTTATDSGVVMTVDTTYKLRIDCTDNANIRFYINDVLVVTQTATLPTASQSLGPVHYLRSLSASGQKDLDTAYTEIRQ